MREGRQGQQKQKDHQASPAGAAHRHAQEQEEDRYRKLDAAIRQRPVRGRRQGGKNRGKVHEA